MTVPDPAAVIRRALLDEESVTDLLLPQTALPNLAAAPIFALEYPRGVANAPQTGYTGHDWAGKLHARSIRMVLITLAGRVAAGGDVSRAPWSRIRFDVQTYAGTYTAAGEVHWAVYEFLKNLSRVRAELSTGTALIHDVTVEGGPISFPDPETESPVMVGTYAASMAEEFVSVA